MTALAITTEVADRPRHREWAPVVARAPQLADTAWRYLDQLGLSRRPATVDAADRALRTLAGFLVTEQRHRGGFAEVTRGDIEAFKVFFAANGSGRGAAPARNTIRQQLGMLRAFFDRIVEWDWPDAPARTPIFAIDVPVAADPLPRFLDDGQAARLLRAAAEQPDALTRLVIELLARTGMRAGELCGLDADAVVQMGGGWWLRIPLGKLHNDRYVPLHPTLLPLLAEWTATHHHPHGLLLGRDGQPLDRHAVGRMVRRVAKAAGLGNVHPHQLRHTLATQAINRGMRLEAIAAMLGHRSLRMTLIYARIANRTVADEYATASAEVDALYDGIDEPEQLAGLQHEHRRMLGNGWCARPRSTDCAFEAVCEGCGYYQTGVEFQPRLQAQHDHAKTHGQHTRVQLYGRLLDRLNAHAG
jgi:integrase